MDLFESQKSQRESAGGLLDIDSSRLEFAWQNSEKGAISYPKVSEVNLNELSKSLHQNLDAKKKPTVQTADTKRSGGDTAKPNKSVIPQDETTFINKPNQQKIGNYTINK
jgi:hypothetical protein